MAADVDNILVLRFSALGDVAMTVPVLYSVARQYPGLRLTVVTRPFFRRLFVDCPSNIGFVDFNPTEYRGVRGLMRFVGKLRSGGFTAVADLHDVVRTRVMRYAMRLHGVPVVSVDKDRQGRKKLTRDKSREFQRNYVDRYADVFARLGYPVEVSFDGLFGVVAPRSGVGIAPFARYLTKTYPPGLMEQVARMLTDSGVGVTLFGARGEEQLILEQWVSRNPVLTSLAGKLSIEDELRAMSRLEVMLTMDSANMHLASLAGTPVVSVWGSTIPQCGFMGYGQSTERAVWLDLPCQPCSVAGLPECPLGTCACLADLPPERVVAAVGRLIRR